MTSLYTQSMRIVSWNCNGALRKKTDAIDSLSADMLIIQECEDPERSLKAYQQWAGCYIWKGSSKNKGIGVFARNGTEIKSLSWYREFRIPGMPVTSASATWKTDELREFVPFRVNNTFNTVAIWTKQSTGGTFGYAGQLWKYLQSHRRDLAEDECLLIGDLNSNVQWDRPDRWWNHTDNVLILKEIGLHSLYHEFNGIEQGNEPDPTLYHRRKLETSYHIDYAFASKRLRTGAKIEVLQPEEWLAFSDHMPLLVELTL